MSNLKSRVDKLFLAREKNSDDSLIRGLCVIMERYGWTVQQLAELPIPTYNEIVEHLNKEAKENEERSKTKTLKGKSLKKSPVI